MNRKKLAVIVIVGGALIATLIWYFGIRDNSSQSNTQNTDSAEVSQTQQETEEQAQEEVKPEDDQTDATEPKPEDDEQTNTPVKQSNPGLPTSAETPTVSTGAGHSSNSPLPLNQLTSSICTATPGSKCKILFVNAKNSKQVSFVEKEIPSDGSAIWDWKGSDVGSGTWNVYAVSGSKKSAKEVIYVK